MQSMLKLTFVAIDSNLFSCYTSSLLAQMFSVHGHPCVVWNWITRRGNGHMCFNYIFFACAIFQTLVVMETI